MSLVFAAVCSHAPGITGRAHLADPAQKDALHAELHRLGETLREARPDAMIVIAAARLKIAGKSTWYDARPPPSSQSRPPRTAGRRCLASSS